MLHAEKSEEWTQMLKCSVELRGNKLAPWQSYLVKVKLVNQLNKVLCFDSFWLPSVYRVRHHLLLRGFLRTRAILQRKLMCVFQSRWRWHADTTIDSVELIVTVANSLTLFAAPVNKSLQVDVKRIVTGELGLIVARHTWLKTQVSCEMEGDLYGVVC